MKPLKLNREIKNSNIRLILENEPPKMITFNEALILAQNNDLIEMSESNGISTCKIFDYRKFVYEQDKNKKHISKTELKEYKMSPRIGINDIKVKSNQIIEHLKKNNKIKLIIQFKGRENSHKELGVKVLNEVIDNIKDYGTIENNKNEEKQIICTINPKQKNYERTYKNKSIILF